MFTFTAPVRLRSNGKAPASRHFVTIPKPLSDEIKDEISTLPRNGRGSVKVQARIGFITRQTSIFPDKKSDSYLLPIKANIRKQLQINEGDQLNIEITLVSFIITKLLFL